MLTSFGLTALPPPKPLASAPTCHEIGGYMPGRLEFETEYENEAETLVKDMEFGKVYLFGGDRQPAPPAPPPSAEDVKPDGEAVTAQPDDAGDESEGDLELKLTVLEMFNERYDRRVASKDLIWDRGLVNYKQVWFLIIPPLFHSKQLLSGTDSMVRYTSYLLTRGKGRKKSVILSFERKSLLEYKLD